ncbi:hypothetical protein NLJ89_g9928 [Agrocybe chaxingu]|uniref:Uncharacterized protein n=1 Tax=Agrocybe chaxingu TaxID=84603 RepID=A0A9W8JS47_9AGAR|nr:hypothetical protein NLJ89_g9928 [Agrocybe chaxingu]
MTCVVLPGRLQILVGGVSRVLAANSGSTSTSVVDVLYPLHSMHAQSGNFIIEVVTLFATGIALMTLAVRKPQWECRLQKHPQCYLLVILKVGRLAKFHLSATPSRPEFDGNGNGNGSDTSKGPETSTSFLWFPLDGDEEDNQGSAGIIQAAEWSGEGHLQLVPPAYKVGASEFEFKLLGRVAQYTSEQEVDRRTPKT